MFFNVEILMNLEVLCFIMVFSLKQIEISLQSLHDVEYCLTSLCFYISVMLWI